VIETRYRVELTGYSDGACVSIQRLGLTSEIIAWRPAALVPTEEDRAGDPWAQSSTAIRFCAPIARRSDSLDYEMRRDQRCLRSGAPPSRAMPRPCAVSVPLQRTPLGAVTDSHGDAEHAGPRSSKVRLQGS